MLFTQQAGPEAFITHGAFERLDVDNHVSVQAAIGSEWGVANVALEGLHSCQPEMRETGFHIISYIYNFLGGFLFREALLLLKLHCVPTLQSFHLQNKDFYYLKTFRYAVKPQFEYVFPFWVSYNRHWQMFFYFFHISWITQTRQGLVVGSDGVTVPPTFISNFSIWTCGVNGMHSQACSDKEMQLFCNFIL